MTDNEIIKAAECCQERHCCDCPRISCSPPEEDYCRLNLISDVLNLINRQKDELELREAQVTQSRRNEAKLIAERDYWISQYTLKCDPPSATAIAAQQCFERMRMEHLQRMEQKIERLTIERDEIRCSISTTTDKAFKTGVNAFKEALLKKIFPYDAVDKKQYSINAYAVERAISEVAEQMLRG